MERWPESSFPLTHRFAQSSLNGDAFPEGRVRQGVCTKQAVRSLVREKCISQGHSFYTPGTHTLDESQLAPLKRQLSHLSSRRGPWRGLNLYANLAMPPSPACRLQMYGLSMVLYLVHFR